MAHTYREIIKLRYPDKKPRKFIDDTYEGIIWNSLDTTPNPSKAELDAIIVATAELSPIVDKNINDAILIHKQELVPHYQYVNNSIVRIIPIPKMSGTSLMTYDNNIPTINEGTQIATTIISPSTNRSVLSVEGNLQLDGNPGNRNFTLALFKDTLCIGAICVNFISTGRPQTLPFCFYDNELCSSFGNDPVVYSLRIGISSSGTWYLNSTKKASMGNVLENNCAIFKEYV